MSAADIDWEARIRFLFDGTDTLQFIAKNVGRGFPMDADRNLISWSDWLIAAIKAASVDTRPQGGDASSAAPFTSGAVPKADAR